MEAMKRKLPLEDLPKIYLGAEVLVCEGIHEMAGLEELCIQGTNVILLEMPFTAWSDALIDSVMGIKRRGLTPVLAHIDRYYDAKVRELLARGIMAQVNAEAFGLFGCKPFYKRAMELGNVVALGSDLHEAKNRDYKRFSRMCKKLGSLAEGVFARTEELLKTATPLGEAPKENVILT